MFFVRKVLRKGEYAVVLFFSKVHLKIFKPFDDAQPHLTNVWRSQGHELCLNFVKLWNRREEWNRIEAQCQCLHIQKHQCFFNVRHGRPKIIMSFLALNINNFWSKMAFSCLLCHHLKKKKNYPAPSLLCRLVFTLDTFVRNALNIICRRDFRNLNFFHPL